MRMTSALVLCVSIVTISLLTVPLSSANVIMGNLPAVNSDFNGQFGPEAGDRKHAISFTMPAGDPVPLGTVRLDLSCIVCPTVTNITVRGDNSGEPDPTIQATLVGPAINSSGILEFAPDAPFDLQPGTTYWIVVDGSPRGLWRANSAGNYPTSDIGATFGAQLEYYSGSWDPTTSNPDFVFNFEVTTEIFTDGFESGSTSAWSASALRCGDLTELQCGSSELCTLILVGEMTGEYVCRPPEGPCETGFRQSSDTAESCEAKEDCSYVPGVCYCPPDLVCFCGGGPPPQCLES